MQWEDERYVRLYCRDTITWLSLKWEGQAVLALLMRKVDRAGVFDLSEVAPVDAVAAVLQMPEEVVRPGLERLLKHKVLLLGNECLVVPNFIEAQEAKMSDKQRAKEHRSRTRDLKSQTNSSEQNVTKRDATVTKRDAAQEADERCSAEPESGARNETLQNVTKRDDSITKRDQHSSPRDETSLCTVLSRTVPSHTDQRDPPVGPPPDMGPLFGAQPSAPPAPTSKRKTRGPSPKTSLPANFGVSAAIEAMCKAKGLPNPHEVIVEFRGKAKANGYRYADWEAAFENWMNSPITAAKFEPWDWERDVPSQPAAPANEPARVLATPEQVAELDRIYRETIAASAVPAMDPDDIDFGEAS